MSLGASPIGGSPLGGAQSFFNSTVSGGVEVIKQEIREWILYPDLGFPPNYLTAERKLDMDTPLIGPKDMLESRLVGFDFTDELGSGETINTSNIAVTVTVVSGSDPSPSSLLSGVPTISGSLISQRVVAGLQDVLYHLRCVVTTSAGNTLTVAGNLPVVLL